MAQDLTLEQKAAALRKAHPAYAAAEVEAALLAHGGHINATAAALVLGADARAEVWGHVAITCRCLMVDWATPLCVVIYSCRSLQVVLRRTASLGAGACLRKACWLGWVRWWCCGGPQLPTA